MKSDHKQQSAAIIFLLFILYSPSTSHAQRDSSDRSIDSPREALERAYAYTGFEEITALIEAEDYSNVSVVTLRDSTIPFLIDLVYNKPVWHVYLDSFYLYMPRCPDEEEAKWNPKRFLHILIDSTSGFFVKAYTEFEGEFDPYLGSEPPAFIAEKQLRGSEVFLGFCHTPPKIRLDEALGAAAGSDPLAAKELTMLLVMQKHRGDTKALWHVLGRGFPPWPTRTTGEVYPQNNYARSVVDATSGQWLYRTLTPHPDLTRSPND